MFELSHSTLYNSLAYDKKPKSRARGGKHGGQNKILKEHQEKVVKQFIQSLPMYSIKPSYDVVYNAIVSLKHAQNPRKKAPMKRCLHKIKTKPIAAVWFTAAQEKDVKAWFIGYQKVFKALKIRDKKNVINFDKAGFRVGCMKGHEIFVPIDIKEFYEVSPENQKSLTIFECIDATGNSLPSPLVVIQDQDTMMDWFPEDLSAKTWIIPSENRFTSDNITFEYLQHYIDNSDSEPEAD
ncbi:hypothetical protein MMC22_007072 [Lobaria immixta]|nr:hypothetical protein [Lobaria immixta]